jgi:hypothetical protein
LVHLFAASFGKEVCPPTNEARDLGARFSRQRRYVAIIRQDSRPLTRALLALLALLHSSVELVHLRFDVLEILRVTAK